MTALYFGWPAFRNRHFVIWGGGGGLGGGGGGMLFLLQLTLLRHPRNIVNGWVRFCADYTLPALTGISPKYIFYKRKWQLYPLGSTFLSFRLRLLKSPT